MTAAACILALAANGEDITPPQANPASDEALLEDTEMALRARIEAARKTQDPSAQAKHSFALAQLMSRRGDVHAARRMLVATYALQRVANEHGARAKTALSLSVALKQLGRLGSAEDAARDALLLDSDRAIFEGAVNQMEQISVAYATRGDNDDAQRVASEVAAIVSDTREDLRKIDNYQQLAAQYAQAGAFGHVDQLASDIISLAAPQDAWRQAAIAYEMLGDAAKEQHKARAAMDYYRAGIDLAVRCGQCELLARLERRVTEASRNSTLSLTGKSDAQKRPTRKGPRFEPLP